MLDRILFFEENFINDFDKQYKSINDYLNEIGVTNEQIAIIKNNLLDFN